MPQVAEMLDWFVRHHPATAAYTIGEIIGEATDRFGIPRKIAENTIETALNLDSEVSHDKIADFLAESSTRTRGDPSPEPLSPLADARACIAVRSRHDPSLPPSPGEAPAPGAPEPASGCPTYQR